MADKQKITMAACANPAALVELLNAMYTELTAVRTEANELNAWAEALGAKLNLDAGVTDADYDAAITAPVATALCELTK